MGSSTLSSSSSISLKILLISTGVLSAATAFNLCFPALLNFAVSDVPVIWSVILSWLKPPYLYVVINGIIITIVASSRFQLHYNQHRPLVNDSNFLPPDALEPPVVVYETGIRETVESPVVYEVEHEPPVIDIETVPVEDLDVVAAEAEDKFVITRSAWNSSPSVIDSFPVEKIQSDLVSPVKEMPLVSSRFAHQRKMAKINPEGVRLRVTKPRKHETLESTWKTITDGRHIPLTRHLRKSEQNHNHHAPPSDAYPEEQESIKPVANFETLSDNRNHRLPPSGGKLRKEGSLSQDELNRRVEAFIKKFNDEMRLQRQESLKRYMDMINRGVE